MLCGKPNLGWQLLVPILMYADGLDFRLFNGSDLKTYLLMRWSRSDGLAVVRPTGVYLLDFFCSGIQFYVLLGPFLCLVDLFISYLYVLGDNSWINYGSFVQTKHLCVLGCFIFWTFSLIAYIIKPTVL